MAGAQREKAAHTAIVALSRDEVTVRNFGQTPVTRLVVVRAEALLDEDFGPDEGWYTTGRAVARPHPRRVDLLPASDSARFSLLDWRADAGDHSVGPDLRWHRPDVTFEYTDAAGTRWRREEHNLPVVVGGISLPGSAAERRRIKRRRARDWFSRHRRNVWKSLRLGVHGKGFTKKSRRKKRERRTRQGDEG